MGYITTASFSFFEEKRIDPLTIAGSLTQVPKFMQGITEAVAFSALSFFFFVALHFSFQLLGHCESQSRCPVPHHPHYSVYTGA